MIGSSVNPSRLVILLKIRPISLERNIVSVASALGCLGVDVFNLLLRSFAPIDHTSRAIAAIGVRFAPIAVGAPMRDVEPEYRAVASSNRQCFANETHEPNANKRQQSPSDSSGFIGVSF